MWFILSALGNTPQQRATAPLGARPKCPTRATIRSAWNWSTLTTSFLSGGAIMAKATPPVLDRKVLSATLVDMLMATLPDNTDRAALEVEITALLNAPEKISEIDDARFNNDGSSRLGTVEDALFLANKVSRIERVEEVVFDDDNEKPRMPKATTPWWQLGIVAVLALAALVLGYLAYGHVAWHYHGYDAKGGQYVKTEYSAKWVREARESFGFIGEEATPAEAPKPTPTTTGDDDFDDAPAPKPAPATTLVNPTPPPAPAKAAPADGLEDY